MNEKNNQESFDASVDIVMKTFAVLIGLALTDLLRRQFRWRDAISPDPVVAFCLFAALTLLSLRYFLGSANHLKATYVKTGSFRLKNLFFFKDVSFLVLFGALAVAISQSREVHDFTGRTEILLLAAAAWGLVDYVFRIALIGRSPGPDFWVAWVVINVLQFVATLVFDWAFDSWERLAALSFAAIYLVCLCIDHKLTLDSCVAPPAEVEVDYRARVYAVLTLVAVAVVLVTLLFWPAFVLRHGVVIVALGTLFPFACSLIYCGALASAR